METDPPMVHYTKYRMGKGEYFKLALLAAVFFGFLGFLFYQNLAVALLMSLAGLLFPRFQRKKILEKRKRELGMQFKEAMASLSSSLAAGRSIENSFREVVIDLKLLYPDPTASIIFEFEIINRRVKNGETIEKAVSDFAARSGVEDIVNFADVFQTCKRTGGDLVEVIRRTSEIIGEKIAMQQDIEVMISQKRFESNILSIIPLGMILLLEISASDYMAPLYVWGSLGPLIMTGCLGILGAAYWISRQIMDIKV
ncbi:MAG TPA: type II secretion system F family protein [Bacillales bacterium]|nr:type II secretion system F family protein [Bacillales bacterium]